MITTLASTSILLTQCSLIVSLVRPRSAASRVPPGGRTSIIFNDEYTAPSNFTSLRSTSTDSQDSCSSFGSPSRNMRKRSDIQDRSSIRSVMEQDNVKPLAPQRVRGAVGGRTSIILG